VETADRIARRLKLSDLRVLREVVDRGGMAKAAQHLNLTQPAISKAIAQMERILGVKVLDRTRHGATPTIYGETLLEGGLAAFDELRQSVARVQYLADPNSGVLTIGCTQPLALGFIPAIIDRMRHSYPGIRFRVLEGDQMTHLRNRRIELAVGRLSSEVSEPDTDEELLFDDPLLVVAGEDNPWTRRRKITLREIYEGPWSIPYYDSHVGRLIIEAFRAEGLEPPHPYVTTYSLHLQLGLAAVGPYITITAKSMLRLNSQKLSLRILPVRFRHQPSPVGIVKLKKRSLSPQAELFLKYARDVARSIEIAAPRRPVS
jgi:DNA-binding transcriptional LysR family regulator